MTLYQKLLKDTEYHKESHDFLKAATLFKVSADCLYLAESGQIPVSDQTVVYAKPPYPNCWYEFEIEKGGIGCWIVEPEPNDRAYALIANLPIWDYQIRIFFDYPNGIVGHVMEVTGRQLTSETARKYGPETGKQLVYFASVMQSILILQNTPKSITYVNAPDKPLKGKKRQSKLPLISFKTLVLDTHLKETVLMLRSQPGGKAPSRLHTVRAHFRVTKTGIQQVRAHWRGGKHGAVLKDYDLVHESEE